MIDDPIFIVGPPRSGTTLLQYCLNAHPQICILPETHFFFYIYGKRYINRYLPIDQHADKIIRQIFRRSGDPSIKQFASLQNRLVQRCRKEARNMPDLFSVLMQYISYQNGARLTGEKTPTHFLFLPLITSWYHSARILFMRRDPRLVAASYIHNKPEETYKTRKKALNRIAILHKLSDQIYEQHKDHCIPVSYHELTNEPDEVLRGICKLLQIEFDEGMLKPGINNSSHGSNPGYYTDPSLKIIPQDPNKWKQVLSPEEADFIEQFTSDSGKLVGYLRSFPELIHITMEKHLSLLGVNPF